MKKNIKYNTALSTGINAQNSNKIFDGIYEGNGILAFQHNICSGLDDRYKKCDAIYSEPAWKDGYEIFTKNSIAESTSYEEYLTTISKVIRELNVPAFLLCGKKMLKLLNPDKTMETKLTVHGGYKCFYAIYNYNVEITGITEQFGMIDYVCKNFDCILDFCCGYGIIVKDAIKYNKNCILSDINLSCLDWINENYIIGVE